MIFSKRCSYAILSLAFMSENPHQTYQVKEISQALCLPYHFLGQIMRDLTRIGFLQSTKGKFGGFNLTRPPGDYTLLEIRATIDGNDDLGRCFFCTRECGPAEPCRFRSLAEPIYATLERRLGALTLEDMTKIMRGCDSDHSTPIERIVA